MINLLNNKWYIPLPDDATDIDMPEQDFGSVLQYKSNKRWNTITLPPGNWRILFTSDSGAIDDNCKRILPEPKWLAGFGMMYKNFMDDYVKTHERKGPFKDPKLSFASLLRSHNLNGRYLIIEKMD